MEYEEQDLTGLKKEGRPPLQHIYCARVPQKFRPPADALLCRPRVLSDLLETRKDVEPEVPRRDDAVHVYGVDLLSTRDIKEHFGDFNPLFVEWINDSSCAAAAEGSPS